MVNGSHRYWSREFASSSVGIAALLLVGGCGSLNTKPDSSDDRALKISDAASSEGSNGRAGDPGSTHAGADASGVDDYAVVGSALCNITRRSECYPDLSLDPTVARKCTAASQQTCRVESDDAGTRAAMCTAVIGPSTNGEACLRTSDCGEGLDCVVNHAGNAGVCRPYCCTQPCAPNTFCDIVPKRSTRGFVVPVCVPIIPCALFTELAFNPCSGRQHCSVVDNQSLSYTRDGKRFEPDGGFQSLTVCTMKGDVQEGGNCNLGNCDDGLTCLGLTGNRICHRLCVRNSSEDPTDTLTCPDGRVCRGTDDVFGRGRGYCD